MGPDSELGWSDEKPGHHVRVDGFWIDETDVTIAQIDTTTENIITEVNGGVSWIDC